MSTSSLRAESVDGQRISESIEQLGSPRFHVRERAMKSLTLIGEPALEPLRRAISTSADSEIQRRATELVARIEKEAENRKFIEAPRYSLKFEDESLRSIVAMINRKTGLQIALDDKGVANPKRSISFEVKDATAFELIAKFMEVAGLKENERANQPQTGVPQSPNTIVWDGRQPIRNQQNQMRIVLTDGKAAFPEFTGGLLRVRALEPEKNLKTTGTNGSELNLKLDVLSSQPANWRGILGVDILHATDEHGQELKQSYLREMASNNPGGDVQVFGGGMIQFQQFMVFDSSDGIPATPYNPRQVNVTLFSGKTPSRQIKELRGVVHGRMLTPPSTLVEISDLSKTTSKESYRSGNITLKVLEVNLTGEKGTGFVRYRLETTTNPWEMNAMGGPFGGQFGGMGGLILDDVQLPGNGQPTVTLREANNNLVPRTRIDFLNSNHDGITMSQEVRINFPVTKNLKTPLKLTLNGQKQVDVRVPFILKNVPLGE